MKHVLFLSLILTTLVFSEEVKKPTVWTTISPDQVTYYSIMLNAPEKFNIVYLKWESYRLKFNHGWTVRDGQWVKVDFGELPKTTIITIPSFRNSGGGVWIVENRTISGSPSKK